MKRQRNEEEKYVFRYRLCSSIFILWNSYSICCLFCRTLNSCWSSTNLESSKIHLVTLERVLTMKLRGIGSIGPTYWRPPSQCEAHNFNATCENKKLGIILVQSYWFIWLFFSFVLTYLMGYIILLN